MVEMRCGFKGLPRIFVGSRGNPHLRGAAGIRIAPPPIIRPLHLERGGIDPSEATLYLTRLAEPALRRAQVAELVDALASGASG